MTAAVVILGATSQIAGDFIIRSHRDYGAAFALFARRPEVVRAFLAQNDLPTRWTVGALSDFPAMEGQLDEAAGIVNFVGVGDPAKAKEMGALIFDATSQSDALARAFCARRPGMPYLFCSSGAVYGAGFQAPAGPQTPSVIPINQLQPQDWYSVAKLHAESIHRAMSAATVLDLRIFNYFSRTHDIGARFLITDMLRCVAEGRVFETTDAPMTRDYMHPRDMCALMMALLNAPPGSNEPVDAYSRAPITKLELIDLFRSEFGLRTEITAAAQTVNATGAKPQYYSTNRAAQRFGYEPRYTSAQSVVEEGWALLRKHGGT